MRIHSPGFHTAPSFIYHSTVPGTVCVNCFYVSAKSQPASAAASGAAAYLPTATATNAATAATAAATAARSESSATFC